MYRAAAQLHSSGTTGNKVKYSVQLLNIQYQSDKADKESLNGLSLHYGLNAGSRIEDAKNF